MCCSKTWIWTPTRWDATWDEPLLTFFVNRRSSRGSILVLLMLIGVFSSSPDLGEVQITMDYTAELFLFSEETVAASSGCRCASS